MQRTEPRHLEDIIQEASKTFVRGPYYAATEPSPQDGYFNRDTHRIIGTNFIATGGPKDRQDLSDFFDDILNAPEPIAEIVALGANLYQSDERPSKGDFFDYCVTPRQFTAGRYEVNVQRIKGDHLVIDNIIHPDFLVDSLITLSYVDETGKTQTKELNVHVLELLDGKSLHLDREENDERLKKIWALYQTSLTQKMLVHCKYGKGRTGHFILTLQLLQSYKAIFSKKSVASMAAAVHRVLDEIRESRSSLVHTKKQFTSALINAHTLHATFLLKKKRYAGITFPNHISHFFAANFPGVRRRHSEPSKPPTPNPLYPK